MSTDDGRSIVTFFTSFCTPHALEYSPGLDCVCCHTLTIASAFHRMIRVGLRSAGRAAAAQFATGTRFMRAVRFTTTAHRDARSGPVDLSYDVFEGTGGGGGGGGGAPLVFLHGLFGSKSNFRSIARDLARRTGRKALTVDARNHGDSAHGPAMTYEAMTGDLRHLLARADVDRCVLIGHSMGGKVAMATALARPSLVEKLVVVDIGPARTTPTPPTNFSDYVGAMRGVEIPSDVPTLSAARRIAEDQLSSTIEDRVVRQFLLTNLVVRDDGRYAWRVNLDAIAAYLDGILGFPGFPAGTRYEGPTLFLAGGKSSYIGPADHAEIRRLFPRADVLCFPGAGHWVHADRPEYFMSSIVSFLQS